MRDRLAASLTKAKKQYEKGKYFQAAKTLAEERDLAVSERDSESVGTLDDWISQLRSQLTGRELDDFSEGLNDGSAVVDVSPAGLVIAGIGSVALLVSVFLPYADASSTGFFRI